MRTKLPWAGVVLLALCACDRDPAGGPGGRAGGDAMRTNHTVRIGFLHHSTGEAVWLGGLPGALDAWNRDHRTDYRVSKITYPATTGGGWPPLLRRLVQTYPWANYPYDYWNLWVNHRGSSRDRGELNLDDLAEKYDVIVFKHCYPVSRIGPDTGSPSVSSQERTIANYRLQYEALRARMLEFPQKRFIVWTGAALPATLTTEEEATRARRFFEWVKTEWDRPGDNIFVWDFHALETEGGLYLKPEFGAAAKDAHPAPGFSAAVAPWLARRIVDVIEGRGDTGSLTGIPEHAARAIR